MNEFAKKDEKRTVSFLDTCKDFSEPRVQTVVDAINELKFP
jgi:hypothetical protein